MCVWACFTTNALLHSLASQLPIPEDQTAPNDRCGVKPSGRSALSEPSLVCGLARGIAGQSTGTVPGPLCPSPPPGESIDSGTAGENSELVDPLALASFLPACVCACFFVLGRDRLVTPSRQDETNGSDGSRGTRIHCSSYPFPSMSEVRLSIDAKQGPP